MKKILLILLLCFSFLQVSFAGNSQEEKIRWHLLRTEKVLRKVDTNHLTESQKTNRYKNLDVLNKYALDGKFPNNDEFPGESKPFFRGSNGNLCAVGFLMYQDDNYKSYVEEIIQTNNLVEVMDIKQGKIFNWLDTNGFTQLEAAMIQPTYSPCMKGECDMGCEENCTTIIEKASLHYGFDYRLFHHMLSGLGIILIGYTGIYIMYWLYLRFIKKGVDNKSLYKSFGIFIGVIIIFFIVNYVGIYPYWGIIVTCIVALPIFGKFLRWNSKLTHLSKLLRIFIYLVAFYLLILPLVV